MVETRRRVRKTGDGRASPFPTSQEIDGLTPRALLQRLGLRSHKGLSQNFLTDSYVVRDIVGAAELTGDDHVLEIGPGLGILTRGLVAIAAQVVAVEKDRELAPLIPRLVGHPERLKVIEQDALEVDPGELFDGRYKVVANLPYHITSPLLRRLLTASSKPDLIVVMVQKEVAERIAAAPGDTSLLSIMVQLYSKVSIVREVPAASFFPPPQVDSAVLKLEVYRELPVAVDNPEGLLKLVAAGFSRRRKQIHNSLSESVWFPAGAVSDVLKAAGIDPARRAQTLSLEEWANLYRTYEDSRRRWQEE